MSAVRVFLGGAVTEGEPDQRREDGEADDSTDNTYKMSASV